MEDVMADGHWWLLGGVIGLVAEALLPGVFLLWLGLAAICTGLLTLALDVPFLWQVVSYVAFATAAIAIGVRLRVRPLSRRPFMRFYPGRELDNDPTNWWAPNRACVEAMLLSLGFRKVRFTRPDRRFRRGLFHAER